MESINRNQTEENRKDVRAQEAVAMIRDMAEKAQSCFFLYERQ